MSGRMNEVPATNILNKFVVLRALNPSTLGFGVDCCNVPYNPGAGRAIFLDDNNRPNMLRDPRILGVEWLWRIPTAQNSEDHPPGERRVFEPWEAPNVLVTEGHREIEEGHVPLAVGIGIGKELRVAVWSNFIVNQVRSRWGIETSSDGRPK